MSDSTNYIFTLTTFSQDADRVATPLVLANNALAMGHNAYLWLTMEGVKLAITNAAEVLQPVSFPKVSELLQTFLENGGSIGVCPPCGKTHGVNDDNMVSGAQWHGASAFLETAKHGQVFSF